MRRDQKYEEHVVLLRDGQRRLRVQGWEGTLSPSPEHAHIGTLIQDRYPSTPEQEGNPF